MPTTRLIVAAAAGLLGLSFAGPGMAAEKQPPACAAIAFRPVPSGLTDGDQDAGLYKSRFGRIVVKASVKSGEPQNYFVEVGGKQLAPVKGAVPKSVENCAKAKRMATPAKPEEPCTGDRFTVLISHADDQRYVLFYSHRAGAWHYCSAGVA
jgi:hypothetical protein